MGYRIKLKLFRKSSIREPTKETVNLGSKAIKSQPKVSKAKTENQKEIEDMTDG